MANEIKLKRGSGSDPSASDLVVGEVAIRTDNGKLFTKKDDGSVAEISGSGGIDDGDKGDITVSNSGGTFTIDDGVVNNAKVASNAAIAGSKISPTFTSNFTATGTQHKFTSGTSGDCHVIIEADSDNSNEGDNPLLTFRQDGEIDVSAFGHNFTGNDASGNTLFIANSVTNGGISFRTGTTNGYTNATERMTIAGDGQVDFAGNVDCNAGLDVTGNISCTGTVDGRDLATDGTKLDGIESNATADQTAAEIKTLLESNGIVNANVDASAAIAGSKIAPDFGSQNIQTTGDIDLPNNSQIQFGDGTSGQLRIYHMNIFGNERNRIEGATGTPIEIKGYASDHSAVFNIGGAAELYYDGQKKLETVTGGTTITGTCTATSFAGDGSNLTGISAGGPTGGGSDKIFFENGQTVTTNYTIGDTFGAACNAMVAGPITINNGVTVTVDTGDNLIIL